MTFPRPRGLGRIVGVCSALLIAASLNGCASAKKNSDSAAQASNSATAADRQAYGPNPPSPDQYGPRPAPTEPAYGPEPIQIRSLVLVCGPGLARSYACVGALRALEEAKAPIGAVLGAEMGGLIAALYAEDGSVNHVEWGLTKIKDEPFVDEGGLIPEAIRKRTRSRKLEGELEKVFGAKDMKSFKLPVRVSFDTASGETLILNEGPASKAIRGTLSEPKLFTPGEWNGRETVALRKVSPTLLSEAKLIGVGPVIVIDVAEKAADLSGAADLVIRPDLKGISANDFTKKREAAFRGAKAVRAKLSEIRHLVGLPPNPDVSMNTRGIVE